LKSKASEPSEGGAFEIEVSALEGVPDLEESVHDKKAKAQANEASKEKAKETKQEKTVTKPQSEAQKTKVEQSDSGFSIETTSLEDSSSQENSSSNPSKEKAASKEEKKPHESSK
jgi:hypothetical protein